MPDDDVSMGAQTVDRACAVLREIAHHGAQGARLVDLARACQLPRPTVHRILQSLMAAEFVCQPVGVKRYKIGVGIFALGLAAHNPIEHLPELRRLLDGLAEEIGDTAYLWMRRGDEMLCIARSEGATPIRIHVIEVGALRPMGASLSGITLMAAMSDDEVEIILRRTGVAMKALRNVSPSYARSQIALVRQHGYCHSDSVFIKGAYGVAVAVPSKDGRPTIAVTSSSLVSRVPKPRVKALAAAITQTCRAMAEVVGESG